MDDADLHEAGPEPAPAAPALPAPEATHESEAHAVFVVTHAFGEHVVGDEISTAEVDAAPPHAFVRRGNPK